MKLSVTLFAPALALSALVGCSEPVSDEAAAQRAYLGLDPAVDTALDLGFDGFNAANSANIAPQEAAGALSGIILVAGQVDQGSSENKEMRLDVTLTEWSNGPVEDADDLEVEYMTEAPIVIDMSLKGLPNADLDGAITGDLMLGGDLEGIVTLDLVLDGKTEPDPADPQRIRRVPGAMHITGTATSEYGVYTVDVTR